MAVKMAPAPDVRTRRRPRAQYHLQCIGFFFVFVFVKPAVYASCRPGYYGNKCVLRCNCLDVNENCDPDGFCSSGCRAGYTGSDCMEKCPVKTYGVDCEKKCVCGDDCPCDPVTGACIYSECKHPQNSSDGSDKTGVWITLALLGLIVFFVATALLLNYLRSNRVGLLKKLKVDSLEKYRRSKKRSSAPAKEETYEEVAGKIYIPLKQPDDHPAQHQDDYVARDDGRHPPGPESNTLMNTKQPDPCKDNAHPGDSITGNSFTSTKRDSKRNVLYVPKASVVRETVHNQPVYENVAEVKGRRFKSSDSPELAEDGSDSATTFQMEAVFPSQDAVASLPQTNMFASGPPLICGQRSKVIHSIGVA
ncbi:uncharacterized protein LOC112559705 isoform X2 [Pomacea canaliculata]|nr:uncharacterized protein LOC112559705 isoform X2 [Pomacea canaliculata]